MSSKQQSTSFRRARKLPVRGPSVCEILHRTQVSDLERTLKIPVIDGRTLPCKPSTVTAVSELVTAFGIPARTSDGLDAHWYLAQHIDLFHEMREEHETAIIKHGKPTLRAKHRQLGIIARYRLSPQNMPKPLYREVASLLAFRLAIYRGLVTDLPNCIGQLIEEIQNMDIVTQELWVAANKVRILGAFRRERIWLGDNNADVAGRLLISHLANYWRFTLGREPALSTHDSRNRQSQPDVAYSEFVRFVHACFKLAGVNISITAVYRRVEDALADMYRSETCEYGCGFDILQKELPSTARDASRRKRRTARKGPSLVVPKVVLKLRKKSSRT